MKTKCFILLALNEEYKSQHDPYAPYKQSTDPSFRAPSCLCVLPFMDRCGRHCTQMSCDRKMLTGDHDKHANTKKINLFRMQFSKSSGKFGLHNHLYIKGLINEACCVL